MSEGSVPTSADGTDVVDTVRLDAVVAQLRESAPRWVATSAAERAALLSRVIADTHSAPPEWNAAACRATGLDPAGNDAGEELLARIGMFARPQKSVVRGPFIAWPMPAWFVTHRRSAVAIRRIFEVQCTLSWTKVSAAVWATLRP
jgi:hypothetical protein